MLTIACEISGRKYNITKPEIYYKIQIAPAPAQTTQMVRGSKEAAPTVEMMCMGKETEATTQATAMETTETAALATIAAMAIMATASIESAKQKDESQPKASKWQRFVFGMQVKIKY
jgi:hypothetical protein